MLNVIKKTSVALTALVMASFAGFVQSAHAVPTIQLRQDHGLSTYQPLVNFDQDTASRTVIISQLVGQGITFNPMEKSAARFDVCGNGGWDGRAGLSSKVFGTLGANCQVNAKHGSFSMKFNASVVAASFGYYLYIANQLKPQVTKALVGGVAHSSYNVIGQGEGYAVISGSTFEELRFVEDPSKSYAAFVSLAFQHAASGVPSPGTLVLLGLSLLGLVGVRRT